MPRSFQITVPASQTEALVDQIEEIDGLLGLRVQSGVSRKPPGDIISLEITNRRADELMRLLERNGLGKDGYSSISTSQPITIVSPPQHEQILQDTSQSSWEEMHQVLANASNMTMGNLVVMAVAGVFAAVGLATSALHLVVAGALIAPAFEPLVRIAMGIVVGNAGLRRGLVDAGRAYAALVAGALAAGVVLRLQGLPPLDGQASYLPEGILVTYWSSPSLMAALVAIAAGVGGAILVWTDRQILTAGVVVALALVPAPSVVALALIAGRYDAAGQGALRWLLDVAMVVVASLVVLYRVRASSGRPHSLL